MAKMYAQWPDNHEVATLALPAEARSVLEISLQRTPNRTPSVRAMQRAQQSGAAQGK